MLLVLRKPSAEALKEFAEMVSSGHKVKSVYVDFESDTAVIVGVGEEPDQVTLELTITPEQKETVHPG
jgi:hypothetical protein